MQIAGILVGCVLLGQASDAMLSPPPTGDRYKKSPAVLEPLSDDNPPKTETTLPPVSAVQAPVQPAKPQPVRMSPAALVADAVVMPSGSTLAGQPVNLLTIMSTTPDRRLHLELAKTYWRLYQAVAEYRYCFAAMQDFAALGEGESALRLAKASVAADMREAELQVTRLQCELAKLARWPAGSALPLPADRPHAGAYRTNFQELFANRTAPESAVLMEKILPLRRQAIDDQASAVFAAEDAWQAAQELHGSGRSDAKAIVASRRELLDRQRAFIRVVCEYNGNIAEYGLVVALPTSSPQELVAMLIGPVQSSPTSNIATGQPTPANPMREAVRTEPGGNAWRTVQPNQALPSNQVQSPSGLQRNEPTPAPPRGVKNEPTLAPPRDGLRQASAEEPSDISSQLQVLQGDAPNLEPPEEEPVNLEDQPLVPVDFEEAEPEVRETKKPALDDGAAAATVSPMYPALVTSAPAVRAKQLTMTLHWDRSLPDHLGKPMTLAECMMRDSGNDRRGTLEAYWKLRECAARYQAVVDGSEMLESLVPIVLERRAEPSGPTDMLRLQSAKMAMRAAIAEAHVALLESQYALAARLGALGDAVWPLASTVPHSGSYLLKLESQPQAVVDSWPVRQFAVSIPAFGESVQQRATAVVEADNVRVAAIQRYAQGRATAQEMLDGVSSQTEQTIAMLETLTEYNQAIGDYVLTILPSNTPADRLVAAMVVKL